MIKFKSRETKMATKYVSDRSGKTIRFLEVNGRLYNQLPDIDQSGQTFIDATTTRARPDDVLVTTFPKSGTHWTASVIWYLQHRTLDNLKIETNFFLEFNTKAATERKPSPRLLTTHFTSELLSRDFIEKRSKVIYVTRDPRDVAVSFFNHHRLVDSFQYRGEWKDYLYLFLQGKLNYGSWFEHTRQWEKFLQDNPDYPILYISYEEMKRNPLRTVKRISDFLGGGHSAEFLQQVVEATSFKNMKKNEDNIIKTPFKLRKGETGDWKNWFTESQSDLFNQTFEREMGGTHAYSLYSHEHK